MIRFAIIGCGRISQRHAEHIAKRGVLVAVVDIIQEKANALASQYNTKAYYSVEEFITAKPTVDIVAICTPNGLHALHSIQCLQAHYHVLCEKPMAIKISDCVEMIKVAKENKQHLFCIKQNRFNPPVVAVKKIIDEGRLGKIYSVQLNCFWNRNADYYLNSWKGTKTLDGGTLFTQFSHFIDLLYWMIGDVTKAKAITKNYAHKNDIEFEDTGAVLLEFSNGAIGTIHYTVNSYNKNMEGSLTIFGEKGTVKIGGQYLNELEYQQIEDYTIENLPIGNIANNYGEYQGSMSNHDKVYDNVIDVLQNNAIISVSSFEGMKTVEIIEKIYAVANKE
ncbi:MAG: Gfo/Idh/MocA family oxidoreductase [Chitinophagaceae bacterium]|nr:Gfo/Idh/MocA family oxidoreductase [Chitinophagaceae bacterium]MCW5905667.1 Gfo/Idh/MocA family oxidoreductase [Chitinophagaceae bacterium]